MENYEVVILGSGIAGMTAGIYLKRNNIKTLIIENDAPGGQLNRSDIIENYPGYVSVKGPELAYNIYEQVKKINIDYFFENITSIDLYKKQTTLVKGGFGDPYKNRTRD